MTAGHTWAGNDVATDQRRWTLTMVTSDHMSSVTTNDHQNYEERTIRARLSVSDNLVNISFDWGGSN